MEGIRGDFLIPELQFVTQRSRNQRSCGCSGAETVERQNGFGWRNDLIRGVVGWVPLIDANVASHLEAFSADAKLKGVRHVLHDEPDDFYMLRDDFIAEFLF